MASSGSGRIDRAGAGRGQAVDRYVGILGEFDARCRRSGRRRPKSILPASLIGAFGSDSNRMISWLFSKLAIRCGRRLHRHVLAVDGDELEVVVFGRASRRRSRRLPSVRRRRASGRSSCRTPSAPCSRTGRRSARDGAALSPLVIGAEDDVEPGFGEDVRVHARRRRSRPQGQRRPMRPEERSVVFRSHDAGAIPSVAEGRGLPETRAKLGPHRAIGRA